MRRASSHGYPLGVSVFVGWHADTPSPGEGHMSFEQALKNAQDNPDIEIDAPVPAKRKSASSGPRLSPLAGKFERLWRALEGPPLLPEQKFHGERLWRFDYCHAATGVVIELEGGVFSNGRHTRGKGFVADVDKYNAATMLGYHVLRLATGMVTVDRVHAIIDFIHQKENENDTRTT